VADIDIALVHRAEQALLGALMAGADPAAVREVRPFHFIDGQHQAIYAAVTGQYRRGGLVGRVRAWLALLGGLRTARAAAYAAELPGLCPRRGHHQVYGAMVLQARRAAEGGAQEGAGPGRQLAGAASWLSSVTGRRRSRAREGGQPDEGGRLAPGTERLARALGPVVARLRGELAAEGGRRAVAGPVLSKGFTRTGQAFTAQDLQDLVLAGLMRYPGAGGPELAGRVPPEAFGSGARRELYVVIRNLIGRRVPVDPLIVAWEATGRQQATAPGPSETAVLALELGQLPTAPGMAGHLGRGLLADHVLTRAYGQDWTRQPLGRPAAASPDAPPAGAATPAPARTAQAAPRPQAGLGTLPGGFSRPPRPDGRGMTPRHG